MLEDLFKPEKVAVIGASREEGKTGHEVFDNLLHDFEEEVVPVNPNAESIHDVKAEDETPEDTDMAVIAVPGKIVPDVIEDCGKKDVKAAVVISAGFSETGNSNLEEEVRQTAEEHGIKLLGPNVLGLINTENSMNASFASKMPEEGKISFMSQSGAFCTAILDYAKAEHIGFKHFVSLGNKAMLNEVDFLDYWRETDTETVLGYTEGIENGREFIQSARLTTKEKPVVMVKSGRTDAGGEAASSHTGSIAGSYEAYKAAFRKAGIIEAESNRDLLNYGRALTYQPLPSGGNIAVVTNAGGPGVVTTDEISEHNLDLADFEESTIEKLDDNLPEEAATHNPVDVIGDAGHERYRDALKAVLKDSQVDAVIVLLTPQSNTEIEKTAKTVAKVSESFEKPVFASFMGEEDVSKGKEILEEKEIPEFDDPKDTVETIKAMKEYSEYRERDVTLRDLDYDEEKADEILTDFEGFEDRYELFNAYKFDLPLTELAEAPYYATEAAQKAGYPIVMKIESPDIHHKTDINGIKTGIESKGEVEDEFREMVERVHHEQPGSQIDGALIQEEIEGTEVAIGLKRDPQFGPMVMVGLGGIYIEALNDVSFSIAPISQEEAEMMIHELRSHEIFEGARGKEDIVEPVKDAIIRLGELGLNHEEIQEVDINPLIVTDGTGYIADMEVILDTEN